MPVLKVSRVLKLSACHRKGERIQHKTILNSTTHIFRNSTWQGQHNTKRFNLALCLKQILGLTLTSNSTFTLTSLNVSNLPEYECNASIWSRRYNSYQPKRKTVRKIYNIKWTSIDFYLLGAATNRILAAACQTRYIQEQLR